MQFKQLRSFRVFIFLLLTIFFTDTVYASGMMVAGLLCDNHTVSTESHHHDSDDMDTPENHNHDPHQKQSTNDQCAKCGHCMACFTVLPPRRIDNMQSPLQAVENSLFEPSYISYISAQPQRPPIS
jgi:ferredoxin